MWAFTALISRKYYEAEVVASVSLIAWELEPDSGVWLADSSPSGIRPISVFIDPGVSVHWSRCAGFIHAVLLHWSDRSLIGGSVNSEQPGWRIPIRLRTTPQNERQGRDLRSRVLPNALHQSLESSASASLWLDCCMSRWLARVRCQSTLIFFALWISSLYLLDCSSRCDRHRFKALCR